MTSYPFSSLKFSGANVFTGYWNNLIYVEVNEKFILQASGSPLTSGAESGSERPKSSSNTAAASGSGASLSRPSSPTPPGGPRTALRRRAAADHKEAIRNVRPASTRSAGAGGSSGTMLKLYTDESPGLKVDPVVVLVLSLGFIFSVVGLHGKIFPFADLLEMN